MKVESVAIDVPQFDPSNARKHDHKNLDAIKGSLTKFGQQKPIVIDQKNIVLAGNGTLAAARALGWKSIWVVRTDLDSFHRTAYAIADNRSSELASWDDGVLTKTLLALRDEDFELGSIGFDDLDMKKLLGELDDSPKDEGESYKSMFEVVIECEDESEQQEVYERLSQEGLKCRVLSM